MVVSRFAPSPTGYVHIGNLRSALYAYLFTRHQQGKLILRIEDTDQARYTEGAEENLLEVMTWAGIEFDESPQKGGENGPYRQSERTEKYQMYAKQLIDAGNAYHCFCTSERLEELRQHQEASKLPTGYDGKCRNIPEDELKERLSNGESHVVRLKVPKDETVIFEDMVRGKVKFASHLVDDQVLLKSDHFPTYHLANVVDDHLMGVTHVIRGEEWLPSTPKHILLYKAFGWEAPQFAHLPLILNEDRSKLSKRQGDVAVEDYIKKGYSKDELLNFIAFLGWNPGGTKEIYSLEELVEAFDISKVQKAGAVFDIQKLNWFREVWKQRHLKELVESKGLDADIQETKQGGYKIQVHGDEDRYTLTREILANIDEYIADELKKDEHFLLRALYSNKEKILQEPEKAQEFIQYYFETPELNTQLMLNEKMKVDTTVAKKALEISLEALEKLDKWDERDIKQALVEAIQAAEMKNGQVLWPLRVALTRVEFSAGAIESAWVFGKEKTLQLISESLQSL